MRARNILNIWNIGLP